MGALSLEGAFWRKWARLGARGPSWFARWAPPVLGVAFATIATEPRRSIVRNLRRVRGRRNVLREGLEVAETFATYASCLTEALGADADGREMPEVVVTGQAHVDAALADKRGLLLVTAHTAGWEIVGALVGRRRGLRLLVAEHAERDAKARLIQDEARQGEGVQVAHIGAGPFAALGLMKHLRDGGAVALQIDRVPHGVRARRVTLLGESAGVPEGPLRLAMLSGAPILPIFTARRGHRRYEIMAHRPIRLSRSETDVALDAAAQQIASALETFARAHPTQWFHFRAD
jgi:lauroyl/myristoyl acyltransferase